jgi:hypothetical protein
MVIVVLVIVKRPIASLHFVEGQLTTQSGTLTLGFINDVKDIASRSHLTGTIKVVKYKGSHALRFSHQIPENIQQRIRNIYPHNNPNNPTDSNKRKG